MSKTVNGLKAINAIKNGVKIIVDSVSHTLGPVGKNAIITKDGKKVITNDGVSIAKSIQVEGAEGCVADILKEVCIKTNQIAGDGTTTATILAGEMINEGLKYISFSENAILLRKGMEKMTKKVIELLKENSKRITTKDDIKNIATISCKDEEIGSLISSAISNVGADALITIGESGKSSTEFLLKQGFKFEKGYFSEQFCTNKAKLESVINNPYIFVVNKTIRSADEILPIMEKVRQSNGELVIVCEDIEKDALLALVINKVKGVLNSLVISAPYYKDRRLNFLYDLCAYTNAKLFSDENDLKFAEISDLGRADKIVSNSIETTIIKSDNVNIDEYVSALIELKNSSDNLYDLDVLSERITRLNGKSGSILVGGVSDVEVFERKLRIEDALNSTKVAMSDGIVCGGGVALLKCVKECEKYLQTFDECEKYGGKIIIDSIKMPLKQMLRNSGIESDDILNNVISSKDKNFGYDLLHNKFCNMMESGIVDPLKVTISALSNACSVASSLLTTDVIVL